MDLNWFENSEELLIKATESFLGTIDQFKWSNPIFEELHLDLEKELFAKQIFESNRIEGEGLSEGDTKKMVLAEFKKDFPKEVVESLKDVSLSVVKINKASNEAEFPKLGITVKYKKSEREIYAVTGHLIALLRSDAHAGHVLSESLDAYSTYLNNIATNYPSIGNQKEELGKGKYFNLRKAFLNRVNKGFYLSEEFLKVLHKSICVGSTNNNNGGPGEYRPGPANIDDETIFLEPSLVPSAMNHFINSHRERVVKENHNPILEAARIKEEFIKIHPFGDFNGRISRIILSGYLRSEGFPFYVILRGTSKDRRRYISAMKHSYRGVCLK
jgi:Fic family protein